MATTKKKNGRKLATGDGPSPIDLLVGKRLKERRTEKGLSQSAVGEFLGVTFQQVQKYERGVNRLSSGMLHAAAELLGVPVNYFFAPAAPTDEIPSDRATLEFAKLFQRLPVRHRPLLRHFMKAMGEVA